MPRPPRTRQEHQTSYNRYQQISLEKCAWAGTLQPKGPLGIHVSLIGCFAIPATSLNAVLCDSLPVVIHIAQVVFGSRISLTGRTLEPAQSLGIILSNSA